MRFNQLKLLVRADAGPRIGTGHVMRMIALGQAWRRTAAGQGGCISFVGGQLPAGLIRKIEVEGFRYVEIADARCDAADATATAEIANLIQPDWIALDGYDFDDPYQKALKRAVETPVKLLVVDDNQHASHQAADAILNQNVYADRTHYAPNLSAEFLLGGCFGLLRSEFSAAAQAQAADGGATTKKVPTKARRLLVTFGGADPENRTLTAIQALEELAQPQFVVDCVVGACYPHLFSLEKFKGASQLNLRIHQNVDRMSSLMNRADLAITAGGSTCYELARCGVPAVVIPIANNQLAVANALADLGVMRKLEAAGDEQTFRRELRRELSQLLSDALARKTMSIRGTLLVDGRGGERVVEKLSGIGLSLRNATMDDAKSIWQWRNDPEVRSVSFQPHVIPWEEHEPWIRTRVAEHAMPLRADHATLLWIAELNGAIVGQVRFDRQFEDQLSKTAIISIVVDQTQRGRGLGKALISKACQTLFTSSDCTAVIAQIKPGNSASEKAFRGAGFSAIGPAIVHQKVALQYRIDRVRVLGAGLTGTAKRNAQALKKSA